LSRGLIFNKIKGVNSVSNSVNSSATVDQYQISNGKDCRSSTIFLPVVGENIRLELSKKIVAQCVEENA
jgi:hypothetical protein